MAEEIAVIISRDRHPGPQHQEMEKQLVAALAGRPEMAVTVIPHLYDLKPDGPAIEMLRSIPGDMIVLGWIYPRATHWVLDANRVRGRMGRTAMTPEEETADEPPATRFGIETPQRTIWCLDLRTHGEAAPYLEEIGRLAGVEMVPEPVAAGNAPAAGLSPGEVAEETAPRWYPVIDYGRCTNCLECLNFCLFGVYGLDDEESIVVEQPDACRDGCPASSRICPAGAIMFPQHDDPAIAGDGAAEPGALKLDLSQLFGGAGPARLAAAERDRALGEQRRHAAGQKGPDSGKPADQNDLDKLVDEVDDLDL